MRENRCTSHNSTSTFENCCDISKNSQTHMQFLCVSSPWKNGLKWHQMKPGVFFLLIRTLSKFWAEPICTLIIFMCCLCFGIQSPRCQDSWISRFLNSQIPGFPDSRLPAVTVAGHPFLIGILTLCNYWPSAKRGD